ncbi:hypothetical protein OVS_03495 [Mycoplasma ovis str. Michigan]|uniref:Lipoprotein n=1 Tax=Mycoplasma ovis str. Michigan TaxID=1415773 RepID=A0ABN4BSC5_9MOLU|nr:hypothetical protein [Mycoplasma ovis]AHC40448.1 hypothetical protein OVS_03495 [Mycoplasma ovis str. Michigan]
MSVSPRILSLCAGLGVGCGGIPLILNKQNSSEEIVPVVKTEYQSTDNQTSSVAPAGLQITSVPEIKKEEENGNCQ